MSQARAEVVEEKLKKKIRALMGKRDPRFGQSGPGLVRGDQEASASFTAGASGSLETAFRSWWRQQYRSPAIEIFEKSFVTVKESVLRLVERGG